MKPAKDVRLILATVACLVTWSVGAAEAISISADAVLSHPDLSVTNPINWSVLFPTAFIAIDRLTIDSYWIGDGLDEGEGIEYTGVVPPFGVGHFQFPGRGTTFHADLIILANDSPSVFDVFRDGSAHGRILTNFDATTTVTYDRVVFTVDGTPAPVPEAGSLLLLGSGLLGVALRQASKVTNGATVASWSARHAR